MVLEHAAAKPAVLLLGFIHGVPQPADANLRQSWLVPALRGLNVAGASSPQDVPRAGVLSLCGGSVGHSAFTFHKEHHHE